MHRCITLGDLVPLGKQLHPHKKMHVRTHTLRTMQTRTKQEEGRRKLLRSCRAALDVKEFSGMQTVITTSAVVNKVQVTTLPTSTK